VAWEVTGVRRGVEGELQLELEMGLGMWLTVLRRKPRGETEPVRGTIAAARGAWQLLGRGFVWLVATWASESTNILKCS
jgi:hypothetical protein